MQAETYAIDDVTGGEEMGGRNDFLGRPHAGNTLRSFDVNPGGYIGYFNPQSGEHESFSHKNDTKAEERMALKMKAKGTRRAIRYKRFAAAKPAPKSSKKRRK